MPSDARRGGINRTRLSRRGWIVVRSPPGSSWKIDVQRACRCGAETGTEVTLVYDVPGDERGDGTRGRDVVCSNEAAASTSLATCRVATMRSCAERKELRRRFASAALRISEPRPWHEGLPGSHAHCLYGARNMSRPLRDSLRDCMLALNLRQGRDLVVRRILELV